MDPGGATVLAPGQLPRHYAPRTPITIVHALADIPALQRARAALLLPWPEADTSGFAHIEVLAEDSALTTVAARLFDAMRRLDTGGYPRIYARAVAEVGLGRAIMDRLRRAATAERD
jgi:L-threonylcarbamoyladenylate synthase